MIALNTSYRFVSLPYGVVDPILKSLNSWLDPMLSYRRDVMYYQAQIPRIALIFHESNLWKFIEGRQRHSWFTVALLKSSNILKMKAYWSIQNRNNQCSIYIIAKHRNLTKVKWKVQIWATEYTCIPNLNRKNHV